MSSLREIVKEHTFEQIVTDELDTDAMPGCKQKSKHAWKQLK